MSRCMRLALALTLGGVLLAAPARADERQANELRERANALREKVQRLNEEGKHDEAQQLKREINELQAKADRVAGEGPREPGLKEALAQKLQGLYKEWIEAIVHERYDMAESLQQKIHEVTRDTGARMHELLRPQLEMMERRIDELRQQGQPELADRLTEQVQKLIQAHRPGPDAEQRGRERGPEGRPGPGPQDRKEMERRLQHLRGAADNLNAIGMQDLAQRLGRQADEIQQALENAPPPGDRGPQAGMEDLRHEIHGLHERLNELNRRLDELTEFVHRQHR